MTEFDSAAVPAKVPFVPLPWWWMPERPDGTILHALAVETYRPLFSCAGQKRKWPRMARCRKTNTHLEPIGYVRTPYRDAREIPKGLGTKHGAEGSLELRAQFEPGLTDIEGFSHLFVIWAFDRSIGYELLGTPPSDDRPHGVFATRSPRRPNPIGLTVVKLLYREGPILRVRGVDMLDGSPILDIKPYLSSIPEEQLCRGWLAEAEARAQEEP